MKLKKTNISDRTAKNIMSTYSEKIFDLYFRWEDEKEYEDFQDYSKIMEKMVPSISTNFLPGNSCRPYYFFLFMPACPGTPEKLSHRNN